MSKELAIQAILDKISSTSQKIRSIEDECRDFFVAPESNGVYTSLEGYRRGLQAALASLRSVYDSRKNSSS